MKSTQYIRSASTLPLNICGCTGHNPAYFAAGLPSIPLHEGAISVCHFCALQQADPVKETHSFDLEMLCSHLQHRDSLSTEQRLLCLLFWEQSDGSDDAQQREAVEAEAH